MTYDVIVVGAGHAGCEAAAAAARMGARVALLTMARDNIGALSCNPAIGGLGKGHLVREIDALDGLIGRAADAAGIQFRLLNRSRGPAVQGPRAQVDRVRFAAAMRAMVDGQSALTVIEAEVTDLLLNGGVAVGVETSAGPVRAGSVVLTTGTFLGGVLHTGGERATGGRAGERASVPLAARLRALLPTGRLKTGTPPRLDGRTVDWAALDLQPGDAEPVLFSSRPPGALLPQVPCGVTRTTPTTHAIVRSHAGDAPVNTGAITGPGPRYCPSLEDKVRRFGDRDGHQVFLEPEGLYTPVVYPNGLSMALPAPVQAAIVRSLPGCERAEIVRPGYAIEYDFIDPRALGPDLQTRAVPGLYLAGQINGTTGYEEAAAQGIVAGIAAARAVSGAAPLLFDRATAYLGVLIDDLVTQGVDEPYRMFTSRAEYRLRLRADNADARLTPLGIAAGVVGRERRLAYEADAAERGRALARLDAESFTPAAVQTAGGVVRQDGVLRSAHEWLAFPGVDAAVLARLSPVLAALRPALVASLAVDASYRVYVARQDSDVAVLRRDHGLQLPVDMPFDDVPGLSTEMVERLSAVRPGSIGQAARVAGVTPAALAALLPYTRQAA